MIPPGPTVFVATLSGRVFHSWFADTREGAVIHAFSQGFDVRSKTYTECRIDMSRNSAVKDCMALKTTPEYLFFFDDDMAIPKEIIPRLVTHSKEANADVLGCLYTNRHRPATAIFEPPGGLKCTVETVRDLHERNALAEVAAVGFGCTLVRTSIFARLKEPYFYFPRGPEGGEDWNFCHDVRAAGGKVFCDFGVKSVYNGRTLPGVAHLGVYPYSLLDSQPGL